jgi:hypothetical protein
LRRVDAPALLLPANKRRACLFHDLSLAGRRRARPVRGIRHAVLVSSLVLAPGLEATAVNPSLTVIAQPRPYPGRRPVDPTREFRPGVTRWVTVTSSRNTSTSRPCCRRLAGGAGVGGYAKRYAASAGREGSSADPQGARLCIDQLNRETYLFADSRA